MAYNFLAPVDQKVRDDGYKFVSQDKYLQNPFGATSGISYAGDGSPVSYANSMGGIMSQAPAPFSGYIPRDGGGDGPPTGPAVDNSQFDYEFDALGALGNPDNVGLTEEEQADVDSVNNAKVGLTDAMKAAFANYTLGPLAAMHSLSKSQKKAEDAAIEAATYGKAHRYDGRSNEYGTHTSTISNKAAQANQDRGRGKSSNAGMSSAAKGAAMHGADGGRVGYFFGGRVNYKAGGRIGFKGGGMDMGNASNQAQSASMGSSKSSTNQGPAGGASSGGNYGGNTNPNQTYGGNNNNPQTNRNDNIKRNWTNNIKTNWSDINNPNINIDYTTPLNRARLRATLYNDDFVENPKDFKAAGDLSYGFNIPGLSPIRGTTSFTDKGIGPTNLASKNITATIDPNKDITLGYNKGGWGISTDLDNTRVQFTKSYANGGRVSFKNGGLASIL